jgi:hypothetical protein
MSDSTRAPGPQDTVLKSSATESALIDQVIYDSGTSRSKRMLYMNELFVTPIVPISVIIRFVGAAPEQ